MWLNLYPANVDSFGADCISYHMAVMMTTDLQFNVNVAYSASDVYNVIKDKFGLKRRSSAVPDFTLDWMKRAISTKWARTGIFSMFRNLEFGSSRGPDFTISGEFGKGQYIKFTSPQKLYSFGTEDDKLLEIARITNNLLQKYHSNSIISLLRVSQSFNAGRARWHRSWIANGQVKCERATPLSMGTRCISRHLLPKHFCEIFSLYRRHLIGNSQMFPLLQQFWKRHTLINSQSIPIALRSHFLRTSNILWTTKGSLLFQTPVEPIKEKIRCILHRLLPQLPVLKMLLRVDTKWYGIR